jgi:hypothetical protein
MVRLVQCEGSNAPIRRRPLPVRLLWQVTGRKQPMMLQKSRNASKSMVSR